MAQLKYPDQDVQTNSWTSTGATYYTEVDEASVDNADYCQIATTGSILELGLPNYDDPSSGTGHTFRCYARASGSGAPEKWSVRLRQGTTTTIATLISNSGVSRSADTQYTYTLTEAEANSISDYNDLRLDFQATTMGGGEWIRLLQAEFEVPEQAGLVVQDAAAITQIDEPTPVPNLDPADLDATTQIDTATPVPNIPVNDLDAVTEIEQATPVPNLDPAGLDAVTDLAATTVTPAVAATLDDARSALDVDDASVVADIPVNDLAAVTQIDAAAIVADIPVNDLDVATQIDEPVIVPEGVTELVVADAAATTQIDAATPVPNIPVNDLDVVTQADNVSITAVLTVQDAAAVTQIDTATPVPNLAPADLAATTQIDEATPVPDIAAAGLDVTTQIDNVSITPVLTVQDAAAIVDLEGDLVVGGVDLTVADLAAVATITSLGVFYFGLSPLTLFDRQRDFTLETRSLALALFDRSVALTLEDVLHGDTPVLDPFTSGFDQGFE